MRLFRLALACALLAATPASAQHVFGPFDFNPAPPAGAGTGDVVGPGSSTDNAIARFDGATGKLLQNSLALITDNGTITVLPTPLSVSQGFNVTQTSPTAGSTVGEFRFNEFNCASGVKVTTGGGSMAPFDDRVAACEKITQTIQANAGGFQIPLLLRLNHNVATNLWSGSGPSDFVTLAIHMHSNAADNSATGSGTGAGMYGINVAVQLDSGAVHEHVNSINPQIIFNSGATSSYVIGSRHQRDGTGRGSILDAAISAMTLTAGQGWTDFITLNEGFGAAQSILTTGNIIKAHQALTVANFANLSNMTVTGNILSFPNVLLAGAGHLGLGTTNPTVALGDTGLGTTLAILGGAAAADIPAIKFLNVGAGANEFGRLTFGSAAYSGADKRAGLIRVVGTSAGTVQPTANMQFFVSDGGGILEALHIYPTGSVAVPSAPTTDPTNAFSLVVHPSTTSGILVANSAAVAPSAGAFVIVATDGVPSASGDRLGGLVFRGTTSGTSPANGAAVTGFAAQAWGASAAGSYISLETTPNGSLTRAERARLAHDGVFTISQNATAIGSLPPADSGTSLRLVGADSANTRFELNTFGTGVSPSFTGRTARGSGATQSAVQANDALASFFGKGAYGNATYGDNAGAGFAVFANQAYTNTNQGTRLEIYTTTDNTTTTTARGAIEADGGITWPRAVTGGSKGSGTVNATALYDNNQRTQSVIAASGAASTVTGTTAETTLATITVPANVMGPNGSVICRALTGIIGAAGTRQFRMKFGGTTYYDSTALAAAGYVSSLNKIQVTNRNATNSQVGTGQVNYNVNTTGTNITSAVDTTAAVTILLTAQLGNAADTFSLESYTCELQRP